MTETSLILSLQPQLVAPDYKTAAPYAGPSIKELEEVASRKDWPGYFGAPALASASLGRAIYKEWLTRSTELIDQVLSGGNYRRLPRYGDLYADDPSDAAAVAVNQRLESQHQTWLDKQAHKP
jgi:hypothetical protein